MIGTPERSIVEKVRETAELGGRQVLMQGGHHPHLTTDWWADLFAERESLLTLPAASLGSGSSGINPLHAASCAKSSAPINWSAGSASTKS